MKERINWLRPYEITKLCETCGADLVYSGHKLLSHPPQYVHHCSAKPSEHPQPALDRPYPAISYERYSIVGIKAK